MNKQHRYKGEFQMATAQLAALDMDKLNTFIGQFVTDLGAAVHAGMVVIGEKLGLYKALAGGPMNSRELAADTHTDERYVSGWHLRPPVDTSRTKTRAANSA